MAKEEVPPKGIIRSLPLSTIAIITIISVFMGVMFAKISSLDTQLNNHYTTLLSDVNDLDENMGVLEEEMRGIKKQLEDLTEAINDNFKGMREDIQALLPEE